VDNFSIVTGDTIFLENKWQTVCKKNIKSDFLGLRIKGSTSKKIKRAIKFGDKIKPI
jgi:hypothetical protein